MNSITQKNQRQSNTHVYIFRPSSHFFICHCTIYIFVFFFKLCPCHTVPKLTSDGHTIKEMFKFGSDRINTGPVVRASWSIVSPPVEFFRLRQQLREWWQNLWHAKKLQEDIAKVHFRVELVCPFYPS